MVESLLFLLEPDSEPGKKIPGIGQKWTGSATLVTTYVPCSVCLSAASDTKQTTTFLSLYSCAMCMAPTHFTLYLLGLLATYLSVYLA